MLHFPEALSLLLWWSSTTFIIHQASAWTTTSSRSTHQHHPSWLLSRSSTTSSLYQSTSPFELDYYYDGDGNPFEEGSSPIDRRLACRDPTTKLVVGLNKYSHDTSICAADAKTGEVLFAMSKERLSRKKHDSGNVVTLVDKCLETLDLQLDSIETVVMNNHHHRILPLEQDLSHMEWENGLGINGGFEEAYDSEENTFPNATTKFELSHHLAHAYSTAAQSPFSSGMVVVMDGMGEAYRTMLRAVRTNDPTYVSDLNFGEDSFQCIPHDLKQQSEISAFDWREAESVYVFEKTKRNISLKPVFKRFTPEKSPPTLYNHGFENMESVGAIYSRASSHIFGDWNACGKVMGLAPWISTSWTKDDSDDDDGDEITLQPPRDKYPHVMWGSLYSESEDDKFQFDITSLKGTPLIARMDPDLFHTSNSEKSEESNKAPERYDFDDDEDNTPGSIDDEDESQYDDDEEEIDDKRIPTTVALDAIALGHRVQTDMETVVLDFVQHFKEDTQEENLCIAGGVGLNSVLNGRLSRELGFKNVYVPPYPGDDGIAVGCCAYALFGKKDLNKNNEPKKDTPQTTVPLWREPIAPYLGPSPSELAIKNAINKAAPWLTFEVIRDEDSLLDLVVEEIESGGVVAWYNGRSELGPRALGHRSILADPRKKGLVRFINEKVKKRESFRPFAPSVLAEDAGAWFELGKKNQKNASPYMSLTATVVEGKRSLIPAVTHVDGSSRLQTVTAESEPLYHKLISKFKELTGVPMVLNTSFNTIPGEPIVDSPTDAIRSFLCSMGALEMLVMGDYVVRRKQPDLRALLGEADADGSDFVKAPAFPKRTGRAILETTAVAEEGELAENDDEASETRVKMTTRPTHHSKNEWFTLLDELEAELLCACDGTNSINEIMAEYTAVPRDKSDEYNERMDEAQNLLQNIVHRLVRLHEHTLISW